MTTPNIAEAALSWLADNKSVAGVDADAFRRVRVSLADGRVVVADTRAFAFDILDAAGVLRESFYGDDAEEFACGLAALAGLS